MRTCPNCGREADDEVVCAGCGTFIAAGGDEDDADGFMGDLGFSGSASTASQGVKTWRVAALVVATCVLAVATAIVLLRQGSSDKHDVALPPPTLVVSSAPFVPPPGSSVAEPTLTTPPPSSSRASSSASRSRSASPTPSRTAKTSASPTLSTSAIPTSSRPHTSPPPSTSSSTPPRPSVSLVKGAHDVLCGPHCFLLSVTLSAFSSGSHDVQCWSVHAGMFGSYTTSSSASSNCTWAQQHDVVWVVVDGVYQSNRVNW